MVLRQNLTCFNLLHLDFITISSNLSQRLGVNYLIGFQYKTTSGAAGGPKGGGVVTTSTIPQFYPTSEGYFDFVKNKYIYNYTDHLGNVRLSYLHNGSSIEVLEENNYYPFGLKHEGYNPLAGNASYQYKYNGKELQESGMYDYGARFYMQDIGRWGVVDPLAEKNRRFTPYNYAINNPIRFIDPDGRSESDWVRLQSGQTIFDSRITTPTEAITAYGGGAEYRANGFTYTATTDGSTYQLGEHGFYLKNGSEVGLSEDYAQYAVDNSGETMQAGLALATTTIALSGGPENPVGDFIGAGEITIYAMQAIAVKAHFEMTKLDERPEGPDGWQYSLRATVSGEYPIFSRGNALPTGSALLNAGDVWKYGETTSTDRYTAAELRQIGPGVIQRDEFKGTQRQIKMMEKAKIYNYFFQNGTLPPGNKIFR